MSGYLLDTHAFIWWVDPAAPLPDRWRDAILSGSNPVFISAVVAWEIEIKKRIGKLQFAHDVGTVAETLGFEELGISMEHAAMAGSLAWNHRDPFDRILAAQVISSDLTLITADAALRSAPGVRVL